MHSHKLSTVALLNLIKKDIHKVKPTICTKYIQNNSVPCKPTGQNTTMQSNKTQEIINPPYIFFP